MASIKVIRRRIRSIENTQKIFKAMETVAAAKLRRAQARSQAARPYSRKITEMLSNLAGAATELEHPLFKVREVQRAALVVITADRGLCGAYNANVLRQCEQILRGPEGESIRLFLIGRKARDYFRRRRYPVVDALTELPGEARFETAKGLSDRLQEIFLSGEADAVDLLFTRFLSVLSRRLEREPYLPIAPRGGEARMARNYLFEPDAGRLFQDLLPRYATTKILQAILESLASEHAARMVAMQSAHKNAGEMIDHLVLTRNRLRQATITKEISEIVGGAEALA